MTRIMRVAVIALLLGSLFGTVSAQAQDINTLFANAQVATQQMVNQILAGIAAPDVATARAQAAAAVVSGQAAIALLQQIPALNPTDAQRSRAEALVTHLTNAVNSAQNAISGPDAQVVSNLNAARGEAQEALAEFPAVGTPSAGDASLAQVVTLATVLGASLALVGLWLRRRAVALS